MLVIRYKILTISALRSLRLIFAPPVSGTSFAVRKSTARGAKDAAKGAK